MKRTIGAMTATWSLFIVVLCAGCAPTPASIEISPAAVVATSAEETPKLAAQVLDKEGAPIQDAQIAWTSANPAVADVDAGGSLLIKASGKAEITATAGEAKASVPVTVTLYTALKIAEANAVVKVGETNKLAATIYNEKDAAIEGEIAWKSADVAIATVNAAGEIQGVAPGRTTITANAKALSANTEVEVQAAGPAELKVVKAEVALKVGAKEKAEAQALDAAGAPAAGVVIAWTTSDTAVATVSPEGEIAAVAKGAATITAQAGDKMATIAVTVK